MKAALVLALAACGPAGCGVGALRARAPIDRVAYPNGRARFEFELRDGLPNGRGKAWYANGKLESDGTYQDGARHGRFWFYNDDGTFAAQALYFNNSEVWRSADEHQQPPAEWGTHFALATRPPPSEATAVDSGPEPAWETYLAPRPYFSTLDRTTAPGRVGTQVGVGDATDLGFGAATRLDVFGHYRIGPYGVFGQLSETHLALQNDMTLGGRRAATVAGTYHHALGAATLSMNGGFIAVVGNADAAGSIASYAGAEQRPADAAVAISAPLALRSGASLTASSGLALVQLDAGVDWLLGGDERGVDPLARANIGIGIGLDSPSAMLTFEFDNSIRVLDSQTQFHAFALGGTIALSKVWFTTGLVLADGWTTSVLGSVGHDL